jgi:segregation and condensation protein B
MELIARIEALLFISARPVSTGQLATALDVTTREADLVLQQLGEQYQERGICLQQSKDGYQLVSAPQYSHDIEKFLGLEEIARLSRAALEVLAIIAYQQPITRPQIDSVRGVPQIDSVRGVNSDSVLRTLTRHGLIEEVGRSEGPGRPFLYSTTTDFLSYFGLRSMQDLPPLQLEPDFELPHEPSVEDQQDSRSLDE